MTTQQEPSVAVKVTACGPLMARQRKKLLRERSHPSGIILLFSAMLIYYFFIQSVHSNPNDTFRKEGLFICIASVVVAVLWIVVSWLLRKLRKADNKFSDWEVLRINEIYEEGLVSNSLAARIVIPYDEITSILELSDMLIVFSEAGEIVWTASDVTPQDMDFIRSYLYARTPKGTLRIRKRMTALRSAPYGIPQVPSRGGKITSCEAEEAFFDTVVCRWSYMLEKFGWWFFLMGGALAGCTSGLIPFQTRVFQSPLVWLCIFAIVFAFASLPIIFLEESARSKRLQKTHPQMTFYETGVLFSAGANQYFVPNEKLHVEALEKGYIFEYHDLCVRVSPQALENTAFLERYL